MGIIRTDLWLADNFANMAKIASQLANYFHNIDEQEILTLLFQQGMYRPNRSTWHTFQFLKQERVWHKTKALLEKYKQEWSSTDVPIFIFPAQESFFQQGVKNGFAFSDKLFLFLPAFIKMAELEALFIHEYHHFTRMEKLKKPMHEYTLLDSLIMEGLAEHAVLDYCGSQYLRYPEIHKKTEELHELWEKLYKKHLHVKKSDPLHEKLLNGTIYSTPFLGYIIGFYLVSLYREKLQNFTINNSFTIPAEAFIPNEQ